MKRIYLSPPDLSGEEQGMILDALASNWITTLGPQVDAFEAQMCKVLDVPFALALSSGTAALHLALLELGVGPGDDVVCPTFTFIATASAIRYCGANPVFLDSNPETWNLDPLLLEEEILEGVKLGKRPKAVIAVDLYGQCADYGAIERICAEHSIPLIEDAAEGLGATLGGKNAGSFGEMGILSFNGNKIITTSGGGMLLSKSARHIDHARRLSAHARELMVHYEHTEIGYNYRMSNLLAAIGRAQLNHLRERVERRRFINSVYREALSGVPGISFMPEIRNGHSTFWLTCVIVDPALARVSREDIRFALESRNIEARPTWKPMHLQPVFKGCRVRGGNVTSGLFKNGLCLPSGSGMSDEDLERVTIVLRDVLRGARYP